MGKQEIKCGNVFEREKTDSKIFALKEIERKMRQTMDL